MKCKRILTVFLILMSLIFFNCSAECQNAIPVECENIKMEFLGGSGSCYRLNIENESKFFKEHEKFDSLKEGISRRIQKYFGDTDFAEKLFNALSADDNIKKFINKYNIQTLSDLGIADLLNSPIKDEFYKACKSWYNLCYWAGEAFHAFSLGSNQILAERNVAASRVAKLLDIQEIVANSKTVALKQDKKEIIGNLMDKANGISFDEFKSLKNYQISPSFQKEMNVLQIFDALGMQCDRWWSNYFIKVYKNKAIGVVAIDNDFHFTLRTDLFNRYVHLPVTIRPNGALNLPHIDKKFALKLLSITDKQLKECLDDILEPQYILATQNRLHQIQNAVVYSINTVPHWLLEENEWNDEVLKEELSGYFGNTYLKTFYNSLGLRL